MAKVEVCGSPTGFANRSHFTRTKHMFKRLLHKHSVAIISDFCYFAFLRPRPACIVDNTFDWRETTAAVFSPNLRKKCSSEV